jgi:plastocyanin
MKALFWTSAVLLSAIVVSGCGGGDSSGNPSPGNTTPLTININGTKDNFSFSPNPAEAGGKSVVYKNNTAETHRVVLNDNSIDTGDIAPGATSRTVTMPNSGTNYHCSLHQNMGGAVEAQGGGAPPPCEGVYCY